MIATSMREAMKLLPDLKLPVYLIGELYTRTWAYRADTAEEFSLYASALLFSMASSRLVVTSITGESPRKEGVV